MATSEGTPVDLSQQRRLNSKVLRRITDGKDGDLKEDILKAFLNDGENLEEELKKISVTVHHRQQTDALRPSGNGYQIASLRQQLKEKCGGDLTEAFYSAVELIPNDDWKEFVGRTLHIPTEIIKEFRHSVYSTDQKIDMLNEWFTQEKRKTGKEPTADEFLNILVNFLVRKGLTSRIIQQNFNGTINAQQFNGYVNNIGPRVQASA